jgi:hypothetical protein
MIWIDFFFLKKKYILNPWVILSRKVSQNPSYFCWFVKKRSSPPALNGSENLKDVKNIF